MSNLVRFEKVDNELNILRIGGKSFLPLAHPPSKGRFG